jgi:hypothetical protein
MFKRTIMATAVVLMLAGVGVAEEHKGAGKERQRHDGGQRQMMERGDRQDFIAELEAAYEAKDMDKVGKLLDGAKARREQALEKRGQAGERQGRRGGQGAEKGERGNRELQGKGKSGQGQRPTGQRQGQRQQGMNVERIAKALRQAFEANDREQLDKIISRLEQVAAQKSGQSDRDKGHGDKGDRRERPDGQNLRGKRGDRGGAGDFSFRRSVFGYGMNFNRERGGHGYAQNFDKRCDNDKPTARNFAGMRQRAGRERMNFDGQGRREGRKMDSDDQQRRGMRDGNKQNSQRMQGVLKKLKKAYDENDQETIERIFDRLEQAKNTQGKRQNK